MCLAPRLKPKDERARKEASKHLSKPSRHAKTMSGYNPLLRTFHSLETSRPTNVNGQFQNINEADDQGESTSGTGADYDSVSNNGSWSGFSEDRKEKPSQPLSHDRREKIRKKNERKHQRQKERRAKELHERCSGLVMLRKLETLAQQLVAMGFSHKLATVALIRNQGRVEESVVWLLEGSTRDEDHNSNTDRLKIDISEELARIRDLEIIYKASKWDVERIVVSCEGDLEKTEETLKSQTVPSKSDEPVASRKGPMSIQQNSTRRMQTSVASSALTQHKNSRRTFLTVGSSVDTGTKTMQVVRRTTPKSDETRPHVIAMPAEKKWVRMASSLQSTVPGAKTDVENDLKYLQLGSLKPAVLMQQLPSVRLNSSPPRGCYQSSHGSMKPNGFKPPVSVSGTLSHAVIGSNSVLTKLHRQPHPEFSPAGGAMDLLRITRGNGSSPAVAASSLGLFSGGSSSCSSGSSSPVDWNCSGGSIPQLDYMNVDWSMDRGLLSSSSAVARSGGLLTGGNYKWVQNNGSLLSYGSGLTNPMTFGEWDWSLPAFEEKELFSIPTRSISSPR